MANKNKPVIVKDLDSAPLRALKHSPQKYDYSLTGETASRAIVLIYLGVIGLSIYKLSDHATLRFYRQIYLVIYDETFNSQ